MKISTHIAAAVIAFTLAVMPVLAHPYDSYFRDKPDRGHPVPGPLAGAGIGYLIAAGSYGVYRFWRRGK